MALLLVMAVVLAVNAWQGRVLIADHAPPGCPGPGESCAAFVTELTGLRGRMSFFVAFVPFIAAALAGMFWGAPLVAQELERKTGKLAWSQSVPVRRWLTVQLGWVLGMVTVIGLALSAMVSMWRQAYAGWGVDDPVLQPFSFDASGLQPVGWCLLACAIGVVAGLVTRRPLVAMGIVMAAVLLLMSVAHSARPYYVGPERMISADAKAVQKAGGFLLKRTWLDPSGSETAVVPAHVCAESPSQGRDLARLEQEECLIKRGYKYAFDFQPASRWWTFQVIEFTVFVGLIVVMLGFSLWRIGRTNV
ncbi:hypothetical protein ACFWYW_44425 [Nonomuraea sp. NPDC059023]|uniref:hypothetical protein n=1 Tax=unclassified Nonomuraea TaxID=2593643 RepID=UPI0036BEDD8E